MPTSTYTPLANITLGSSAASVTFSSISQAYRDLVFVMTGTKVPLAGVGMQFNDDTGSNYSFVYAFGGTAGILSSSSTTTKLPVAVITTSYDNVATTNIMDYTATDKHKSVLIRRAAVEWGTDMVAGRWANTAAITKIKVFPDSGSFTAGSTFALYGIAA